MSALTGTTSETPSDTRSHQRTTALYSSGSVTSFDAERSER